MFDKASLQGAESTINWSLSLESITSRTLEGKGEGLAHSSVAGWLGMLMTVTKHTTLPAGFISLPVEKSWEIRILNL